MAEFEKGPLLVKMRGLLQGNLENRKKWASFCQVHAAPSLKPEAQDEAFLMTYMEALETGGIPELMGELPAELQEPADWKGAGKGKDAWGGKGGGDWGGKGGGGWGGKGGGDWGKGGGWGKGDKGGKGGGKGGGNSVGKLFCGGLPKTCTEQSLHGFMSQWGAVKQIQFKYGEDGLCKGFAFVTFEDPSLADQVVQASQAGQTQFEGKWIDCKGIDENAQPSKGKGKGDKGKGKGKSWDGGKGGKGWGGGGGWDDPAKRMRTDEAGGWGKGGGGFGGFGCKDGGKKGGGKSKGDPACQVFVGGLPRTATEEALTQAFGQYAPVSSVNLKYDEMGGPRGFAFVYFQDPASAQMVAGMGSAFIDGKQVTVAPPGGKGKGK